VKLSWRLLAVYTAAALSAAAPLTLLASVSLLPRGDFLPGEAATAIVKILLLVSSLQSAILGAVAAFHYAAGRDAGGHVLAAPIAVAVAASVLTVSPIVESLPEASGQLWKLDASVAGQLSRAASAASLASALSLLLLVASLLVLLEVFAEIRARRVR